MRGAWFILILVLGLAACSQRAPQTPTSAQAGASLANVPACSGQPHPAFADNLYPASECKLVTPGQTFHVKFAGAQGDDNGVVTVDVLLPNGAVVQTLREDHVSDYADPEAVDFDEDGYVDLEIPLLVGNDNRDLALWRFDPAQPRFVRLGDVSGIIHHTRDGFLAVAGKSSAAEWDVSFYRIGESALNELITVNVTAEGDDQGNVTRTTCTLGRQGPAFASLGLNAEAARARFCAEPAARVFDQ
ncbi:MAG: hypothetical protein HY054_08350 [Proteobacteria bacterium]|nr:hypothetical protein [Pseudomonadota bacterium]